MHVVWLGYGLFFFSIISHPVCFSLSVDTAEEFVLAIDDLERAAELKPEDRVVERELRLARDLHAQKTAKDRAQFSSTYHIQLE